MPMGSAIRQTSASLGSASAHLISSRRALPKGPLCHAILSTRVRSGPVVRVHAGVIDLPARTRGRHSKTRNEINRISSAWGIDDGLLR